MSETALVELKELDPGKTHAVEVGSLKILICNVDGDWFAIENMCTHAKIALTSARLIGLEIECPVHGARFDVRTGSVMCLPARRGLRVFPLTRVAEGALISLD